MEELTCAGHDLKPRLLGHICIIIIIISLLQSTAGHRPLQYLAISLDLRLHVYGISYMYGRVIISRQLHFHIYYLFVGPN
jgi:hypothetical protein